MVERRDLLDGDFLAGWFVEGGADTWSAKSREGIMGAYLPNNTIGTFTDNILNIILVRHIE
jgi:hypothetical protein